MAIVRRNNDRDELDMTALVRYLIRHLWIMFLVGVLAGGCVAGGMYKFVKPKYEASVRLYVNNMTTTKDLENISYADISASIMLTDTYLTIIDSDTIFDAVQKEAGLNYTRKEMSKKVSYEAVDSTEVIKITSTSTDPEEAALIANTYGDVVKEKLMDIVDGSSVKILDHASVPKEPESRGLVKMGLLGFLAGAVLTCLVLLLRALNEKSVRSVQDLEYFGKPVLGRIPEIYKAARQKPKKTKKKNKDHSVDSFILLNEKSPFSVREAYNSLRTNLVYSFSGKASRVILVTSTMEHEGKTSTSLNLAKTLSESGYKVLLIDGDLRRSTIARSLEVNSKPGLSDYLAGVCDVNSICQNISDNLFVFAAGTIPPNPNSLLSSVEMQNLVEAVGKVYDYVIIDAPPVEPVSDPVILARLCAGYIVVVRNNVPNRDDIRHCLKEMNVSGIPMLGFVFTCDAKGAGYSNYNKYGYYNSYR